MCYVFPSGGNVSPPPFTLPWQPYRPPSPVVTYPLPRKIKRVEYHDNGTVKSVEYED